ncbi:MAG: MFS transporter [Planctomycetota bacterium]|nr:MAG: MFS transporter [Planctomycetota bacterium]
MNTTSVTSSRSDTQLPPNLFRNTGFLLLWSAYGVSAMGDHISEMAVLKWINAIDSPQITRYQAMITFMFMLPFFFLGPLNGMLADRLPRRGLMIFADLIRALIMFNFAYLLSKFAPFGNFGTFMPLLIVGIFAALFSPARFALMPTLIREDQLVRGNAMISGLGVISTMLAAAIGGWLANKYLPEVSFNVDACTFIVSAILLIFIRPPRREVQRHRSQAGVAAMSEAVRYIRMHKRVAQLIAVGVVVWLCGSVVRSTIPAVARDFYGQNDYLGISLFLVRLGLGMLIGALILTALGDALRSEIAITWSLAGIGISIGMITLSVFLPVSTGVAYHMGGFAVILSGVFGTGVIASYNALLQRIVPNRLLGRVSGIRDFCLMAGLLLATGLLGIPAWKNIDQWVGWILLVTTLIVLVTAVASFTIRLRSGRLGPKLHFWWNVNEFYCKWWFRLKREGICTVPADGPVIVIANHTCSIDPLLLVASIPNRTLGFLIAHEYARLPITEKFVSMIECIPVKREEKDTAATRAALRHLRAGKALGIFIEGRIPKPGEKVEPKEGAVMLALHTEALIVPAHISGTIYDKKVSRSFFRRHRARVRFGKPIDLRKYWIDKLDKKELTKLSNMLMHQIEDLAPVD